MTNRDSGRFLSNRLSAGSLVNCTTLKTWPTSLSLSRRINCKYIRTQDTKDGEHKDAHGRTRGSTDEATWGHEDNFLSLDDLLEEGADIDLDEGWQGDDGDGEEEDATDTPLTGRGQTLAARPQPALLSGGAGHLLKPPPAVLSLLAAGDRGLDTAGLPKLSSCAVHPLSGALLIDAADGRCLDAQLRPMFAAPMLVASTSGAAPAAAATHAAAPVVGFASPIAGAMADDGMESDGDAPMMLDAYDYEGGGGGGDYDYPEAHAPAVEPLHAALAAPNVPAKPPAAAEDEDEEEDDPWAPLDPYAKGPLMVRALRKGRTTRRTVKAAAPPPAAPDASFEEQLLALGRVTDAAAEGGFFFKDLAELHARATKTRRAEEFKERLKRRNEKKAAAAGAAPPAALPARAVPAALELEGEDPPAAAELLEEYEYMGGGGGEEYDYDAGGAFDAIAGGFGSDLEDEPAIDLDLAMRDLAAPYSARRAPAAEGGTWIKGLTPRRSPRSGLVPPSPAAASYEDLVRRHMDELLAAAASAQVQSNLQRAVGQWREKIEPVLAEQDARPAFDIHSSGDQILSRLETAEALLAEDAGGVVPFREVCATEGAWEVSRGFAALLQLINNGNVQIQAKDAAAVPTTGRGGRQTRLDEFSGRVMTADEFALVLLDSARAEQRFDPGAGEGLGGRREGPGGALADAENEGPEARKAKKARKGGKKGGAGPVGAAAAAGEKENGSPLQMTVAAGAL